MPNISINTYSHVTCGCVIEKLIDLDNLEAEPTFLMMSTVCDDHFHLATEKHKPNHKDLSDTTTNHIETIKKRNIDTAEARRNEPQIIRSPYLQAELEQAIQGVKNHNEQLTKKWNYLVQPPFAFDEHIHTIVKDETDKYSKAQLVTLQYLVDNNLENMLQRDPQTGNVAGFAADAGVSHEWQGKAPNRKLTFKIDKLPNEHKQSITEKIAHPDIKIG